jgi:hypothetical protein
MSSYQVGFGSMDANHIVEDFDDLTCLPPVERIVPYPKPRTTSDLSPETKAQPQRYAVWPPSQFIAYIADPAAMLLGEGFIEKSEWTSLVGIGGLGKTRLLLWLCICIITGREWCGIKTTGRSQKCLLLSTESGLRRWKTDLEAIYRVLTSEERVLVESHLRLLALTPEEEGDLNLGDPESVARLGVTLEAEAPDFIGLDPFADMVDGDENSTADMVKSLRTLRTVHRKYAPQAAIVIVHHARTGPANVAQAGNNYAAGNFGRGAKALYSRVRCELQLAPGHSDDSNLLVLACGKANNCEKFKARGLVFNPETFAYTVDETFDLDAWRADVSGQLSGKTVSIADVVESVRILCPHATDTVTTKDLVEHVKDATGAGIRTIKDRLREAVEVKYLRQPRHGFYALGSKPLKK